MLSSPSNNEGIGEWISEGVSEENVKDNAEKDKATFHSRAFIYQCKKCGCVMRSDDEQVGIKRLGEDECNRCSSRNLTIISMPNKSDERWLDKFLGVNNDVKWYTYKRL